MHIELIVCVWWQVESLEWQVYINFRKCNYGHGPLYGKDLVVSLYSVPPMLFPDNATGELKGGVAYDILNALADHHGFKWTPRQAIDFFVFHQNGSIGGSLGEV